MFSRAGSGQVKLVILSAPVHLNVDTINAGRSCLLCPPAACVPLPGKELRDSTLYDLWDLIAGRL